jgi:predicted kinase
MTTVHIVFGPQGAGKSTYASALAGSQQATHFSIDQWMAQLYGPDLPRPLDIRWIFERVERCERQIWTTACQIASTGGDVVLDLGFMKQRNRAKFIELCAQASVRCALHYVTANVDLRRRRVSARNAEKGSTFAFEVTPAMFNFMEKEFEQPSELELDGATVLRTDAP